MNLTQGYIEKSFQPNEVDLQKINQYTRTAFSADRLYVFSVVLCDNDIDRDYEKFSVSALNELKEKFVGKTGIFDHSMKAQDQKARIFDTWVEHIESRKTADGEDYYCLKAKAYMLRNEENQLLISEIDAGIKKEVSVSCQARKSICSICSNDKRSGYCEHFNGKEYNGKTAFSVLSDISDAYEFSFVAVPAQRNAGVTKSFDLTKEDKNKMTEIIETLKNCDGNITLTKSQAMHIADKMQSLDEDAKLGREYKKKLTEEVVSLCAIAMPDMDLKVFSGVTQVMTTKELMAFKDSFKKMNFSAEPTLQLASGKAEKHQNNQFKL